MWRVLPLSSSSSSSISSLRCCTLLLQQSKKGATGSSSTTSSFISSAMISSGSRRFLSTTVTTTPLPEEDEEPFPAARQPFVHARIRPAEWDPEYTDPLYRPKYKGRNRILSSDDYATAPVVVFDEEEEEPEESGVPECWLDAAQARQIYQFYLDLIQHSAEKHKNLTSHEYVVRVIAQKYNFTAERVAAIILLQHNEEQMLRENPDDIDAELEVYMDENLKRYIEYVYEDEAEPDGFVEDVIGQIPRKPFSIVEDVYDLDQVTKDMIIREDERARKIIDEYVYIEDVDDDTIPIPLSTDAKALLRNKKKLDEAVAAAVQKATSSSPSLSPPVEWPKPVNSTKEHRKRWKFVAQVINTETSKQLLKQQRGRRKKKQVMNLPENTIVEEDGVLRAATMADVRSTAWKPQRNPQEHIYRDVKLGWLDKIHRGNEKAWGLAPPEIAAKAELAAAEAAKKIKQDLAASQKVVIVDPDMEIDDEFEPDEPPYDDYNHRDFDDDERD